jgi:hypothetical protein
MGFSLVKREGCETETGERPHGARGYHVGPRCVFLLFSDWAGFEYRDLRREGKIKERA